MVAVAGDQHHRRDAGDLVEVGDLARVGPATRPVPPADHRPARARPRRARRPGPRPPRGWSRRSGRSAAGPGSTGRGARAGPTARGPASARRASTSATPSGRLSPGPTSTTCPSATARPPAPDPAAGHGTSAPPGRLLRRSRPRGRYATPGGISPRRSVSATVTDTLRQRTIPGGTQASDVTAGLHDAEAGGDVGAIGVGRVGGRVGAGAVEVGVRRRLVDEDAAEQVLATARRRRRGRPRACRRPPAPRTSRPRRSSPRGAARCRGTARSTRRCRRSRSGRRPGRSTRVS